MLRKTESVRHVCGAVLLAGVLVCVGDLAKPDGVQADDPYATLKISRLPAGTMAPVFELNSLDGRRVQSKDLNGKVVLLNFWATWCGPCKEEMPSFERLQRKLDPSRFTVVTITADLQREGIKRFLSHLGVHVPVLFDEDQDVSRVFMVRGLPTTVVIGRDGSLIGRAVGPRAWDSPESVALMQQLIEPH